MDKLIYTAMTGASHVMNQQATVSENLANASTPGFRAALQSFRAIPLYGEGLPTRTFVVDSTVGADFAAGPLQRTERDLDLALPGEGWLVVQDANGKEALTRNGSLTVSVNGQLQTHTGLAVVGDTGPITIPPDTRISIARDGTISTVPTDGGNGVIAVGRLKLANPPPSQLVRGGDGLFRLNNGRDTEADPNVTVISGTLEGSNVNTAETLVNMISLARKFDLQMKLLQNADNNARQASQLLTITG